MNTQQIEDLLVSRGYDTRSAKLVAPELLSLDPRLNSLFEAWLSSENNISDFSAEGVSISDLMRFHKMQFPAALLTMDWVLKDPIHALKSLNRY